MAVWPVVKRGLTTLRETLEEWREAVGTIQSVVLTAAALIAGLWAAYSFNATQQARRAQIELDRLERVDRKRASEVDIDVQQAKALGKRRPLIITVTVANKGSRDLLVDLSKPRLGVSLVRFASDSAYPRGAAIRYETAAIIRLRPNHVIANGLITLGPETSTKLSYLIVVDRPGLYLVDFTLPSSREKVNRVDSLVKATGFDTVMARALPNVPYEIGEGSTKYIEVR